MMRISGKDFLKSLNLFNIDTGTLSSESLDWLFDNKESNSILTWLCTYVNESNVVTCTEQYESDILQKEGTFVEDDSIDEAVSSINITHSGILEVNTNKINALMKELEIEQQITENNEILTSKLQSLESKVGDQINKLMTEEIDTRIQRQSALSEYEAKCKRLDEIHNNMCLNVHKHINLSPKDNSFNNYKFCMYKEQSECFNTNFDLWLKNALEDEKSVNIDHINKELNRLKYVIEESIFNYVKAECTEKELKSKMLYVRSHNFTELSDKEMMEQNMQLTCRIHSQYEDLERLYATELPQAAEQRTENLINGVLLQNAEVKLNRSKDILKLLRCMNKEATNALAQFQLVNLFLKTDKDKIHVVDNFLDDTYFYTTKYIKQHGLRLEYLDRLNNETPKDNSIINQIISLLMGNDTRDPISINQTLAEIEKRNINIENLENNIFNTSNTSYLDEIKNIQCKFGKIKQYICCGPTIQPVLLPWEYLESLSNSNLCLNKINKVSKTCMENYKQTLSLLEKNRWLKCKHLLWMWFITNPEKLITTTDQLRDFINEQARTNS